MTRALLIVLPSITFLVGIYVGVLFATDDHRPA